MALTPQQAQADLQRLLDVANQLGKTVDSLWQNDPMSYANDILNTFVKWDDELKTIQSDLNGISSIIASNLGDLGKSNTQLIEARKHSRQLMSISQKLAADRNDILDLDKKSLEKLIQQTTISSQQLQNIISSGELKDEELLATQDILAKSREILGYAQERLELEKEITKSLGLSNSLMTGMQKTMQRLGLSGLSDALGLDDAISKTREFTKETVARNTAEGKTGFGTSLITNLKSAGNLIKNIGSNLTKALGPVAIIAMLVDAMLSLDKTSGDIAKQFGISYDQARGINNEVNAIAYNTGNVFVDAQKINESFMALSTSLGTNTMLSADLLVNFTELTQQAGYSVEAATTLSKISLITNKSSKDLASSYLGQVKLQNVKNNLAINEKALLNDINNVSKSTLLIYSKNPAELGKAAFEAKKLGLELKQIENISQGLLDIESSISAEFEAEVMTGKQLNLERARYYALTNNLGGLAKELNKQNITFASFGKLNVLQQEAQAKALGMSREEMANMLMEQEAIRKVGAKDIGDLKEKLRLAQAQGKEAEFIKQLGDDTLANQLKSTSAQERFQATLTKLQDIFTQIAEPLMPILDIFAEIFTILGPIISLVSKQLAPGLKAVGLIVTAISDGLKGIVGLFSGKGFDFSATKSSFEGLKGAMDQSLQGQIFNKITGTTIASADDGIIDSSGGLVVSGPKGSVSLDKEDTIIGNKNGVTAGTNLFDKSSSNEGGITVLSSTLGNKMDVMINKLDNLITAVNKGMTVNLDGNKVSQELLTPLAITNRNV